MSALRELVAALPDAEELLDGLAVQMACVHAAAHVENFWKSLKPCGFGRHRAGNASTPRQGAIRHYMIVWRLRRDLTMNDKGCQLNRSMQHMH